MLLMSNQRKVLNALVILSGLPEITDLTARECLATLCELEGKLEKEHKMIDSLQTNTQSRSAKTLTISR